MTFQECVDAVRDRFLAEPGTAYYTDTEMLEVALLATNELAARLSLPRDVVTVTVTGGNNEVNLPGRVAGGQVFEALVDGRALDRAESLGALRSFDGFGSELEAFWVDPRRARVLTVAPQPDVDASVDLHFLSRFYLDGDTYRKPGLDATIWGRVWTGVTWTTCDYPHLDDLFVLATTVGAWRMGLQLERASYYQALLEARVRETAVWLGTPYLGPAGGEG